MTQTALQELLLAPTRIPAETRRRMSADHNVTVPTRKISEYEAAGWLVDRRNKKSARMRKPKADDVAFVDRVWATFAKLNFGAMNADADFGLSLSPAGRAVPRVDVFAADDEVALVIVCASSPTVRTRQFRRELEAIQEQRPGLLRVFRRELPHHKVKFILATSNLGVTPQAAERIQAAGVIHMDENVIDYYMTLADHLGRAARYQLLGNLFHGERIPNIDPAVVAIEAAMGGHRYYSFSIEPERLLKMAYILHRNKANSSFMPTYQRLVKKARLRAVSQFVNHGGFSPNSLILSIDAGPRGLKFEPLSSQSGAARAGILHLPQTFRAAYVIDGQHRLYGYADSPRAATDWIPVVAFVNLARPDQVRLFMQINENQQAVPKNLRNTLNADLLYDSDDLREQIRALKLYVAQQLGEDKASPLYGRVQVGENPKTALRCLTIDAISRGVERGNFLGSFARTEVKAAGSFYRGSNEATAGPLLEFLQRTLAHVRDGLDLQFKLGSAEGGFVFINNGIESIIRILGDVVDHLAETKRYDPRRRTPLQLYEDAEPYLDTLINYLKSVDAAAGLEFRQMYGAGAGTRYWRRLQQAINAARPDFAPPGLAEYLESEERQFNAEAREMIATLAQFIKDDVRRRLQDEHGVNWLKAGVPRKIQIEAGKAAVERNADRDTDHELEPWDCLNLVDYQAVMTSSHDVWKRLFEKRYTPPGDENKPGGWRARSSWLNRLNELRNDVMHERAITAEGHDFLVTLTTWLIDGQADNDL